MAAVKPPMADGPASQAQVSLAEIAGAVLGSSRPFTHEEREVVRAAYFGLAQGSPISPEHIASAAGVSADTVRATIARWPGLAHLDNGGRVIACLGLTLERTPHGLEIEGRPLYTWCAWDTLFIPRLLGVKAAVTSRCPITGTPIRLLVTPSGLAEVIPAETAVSFLLACVGESAAQPVGACCRHIHFLHSPLGTAGWLARNPGGVVLSIDEAWELGRLFVDTRLSSSTAGTTTDPS